MKTFPAIMLAAAMTATGYSQDWNQRNQWGGEFWKQQRQIQQQECIRQAQVARYRGAARRAAYEEAILQQQWEQDQEWNALRQEAQAMREELQDEIEALREELEAQ